MKSSISHHTKGILEANEYLHKTGIAIEKLAQLSGLSDQTVRLYLKGEYAGNVHLIGQKIKAAIAAEQAKESLPQPNPTFVHTSISKRIFDIAHYCHSEKDIGVIIGEPGLGKTVSVKEFVHRNNNAILVEARPGFTATRLFSQLSIQLNYPGHLPLHSLFDNVIKRLEGTDRLVIADEAEHLAYNALEMLRRVHDFTGVGMVLTGLPKLLANLRGERGEYAQLYSRVGVAIKLEPITENDVIAIVKALQPESIALTSAYYCECRKNARRLIKLIRMSARIASNNNRKIDAEVIEAASEQLIR